MAYFRQVTHLRTYSSSSRSAVKDTSLNLAKVSTNSFISLILKSITYASSYLKPLESSLFPLRNETTKHLSTTSTVKNSDKIVNGTVESSVSGKAESASSLTSESSNRVASKDGNQFEETFYNWMNVKESQEKLVSAEEGGPRLAKTSVCKSSLEQRSRFLVHSLRCATSPSSRYMRLEEICRHLVTYPQEKNIMYKGGLLRTLLWLRTRLTDPSIQAQLRVAMSLLGYHDPPNANGIRILSIDGGGTRGIMAIEMMRQLEDRTGKKIHELFDFICGVSSGAILALLVGGLKLSVEECETLYRKLSLEVFKQSPIWGTGRLVWHHAYYDTTIWVNILKSVFEEKLFIDSARDKNVPKLAAISAIMNLSSLQAFVFRNYAFPPLSQSQYLGSCKHKIWEAVRASGAAPGYFEEICLDNYVHQDGGVMINNPAAVAIHEARLLWPLEPIQCVVSLGCGRYSPSTISDFTSTSLKMKVQKIIDSATDTEGVHITLHDLLSSNTYFRFNPYLTEFVYLDENRPEKLHQLKTDAQMYLRRNEYKLTHAANVLNQTRSPQKRITDWFQARKLLVF